MECSFPLTCFCHTNWKGKTKAGVPRAWLGQKQKRTWKQGLREMPGRNGRHYYLAIRLRIAVRLLLPRMRTHWSFLLPVSGSSLSSIFEMMMQRQSVLFICFSMAVVTAFGMDLVCLDNPSTAEPHRQRHSQHFSHFLPCSLVSLSSFRSQFLFARPTEGFILRTGTQGSRRRHMCGGRAFILPFQE